MEPPLHSTDGTSRRSALLVELKTRANASSHTSDIPHNLTPRAWIGGRLAVSVRRGTSATGC
jgi:hypothetical protein